MCIAAAAAAAAAWSLTRLRRILRSSEPKKMRRCVSPHKPFLLHTEMFDAELLSISVAGSNGFSLAFQGVRIFKVQAYQKSALFFISSTRSNKMIRFREISWIKVRTYPKKSPTSWQYVYYAVPASHRCCFFAVVQKNMHCTRRHIMPWAARKTSLKKATKWCAWKNTPFNNCNLVNVLS